VKKSSDAKPIIKRPHPKKLPVIDIKKKLMSVTKNRDILRKFDFSCIFITIEAIVAITAKPEAQIWQEVKPAAIIHIIGETKIKEAESSAEHSEEVLRFKKAAPMGTSFELSAGLYLLSMIECLVKGVVTKADLQRKIKRYFEKVSKAVESNNFKMNLSEDKISKIAYLISEVKYTPRAKIYNFRRRRKP